MQYFHCDTAYPHNYLERILSSAETENRRAKDYFWLTSNQYIVLSSAEDWCDAMSNAAMSSHPATFPLASGRQLGRSSSSTRRQEIIRRQSLNDPIMHAPCRCRVCVAPCVSVNAEVELTPTQEIIKARFDCRTPDASTSALSIDAMMHPAHPTWWRNVVSW